MANPLKVRIVRIMKLTLATNLPMSFPWVSKHYSSNTTGQTRLDTITMKWVLEEFQDVHKGLGQLGRPVTFDMEREASPRCHSPPACSMPKLRYRKAKWKAKGRHADSVSLQLGVVTKQIEIPGTNLESFWIHQTLSTKQSGYPSILLHAF